MKKNYCYFYLNIFIIKKLYKELKLIKNLFRSFRQNIFKILVNSKGSKFSVNSKTTLIIAPHPDDETFGCAGLIFQKKNLNSKVYVLFLTGGEGSIKDFPKEEIKENRIKTSKNVCLKLKVDEVFNFDIEDGKIDSKDIQTQNKLKKLILEKEIKEVYVTHEFENWSDHNQASKLAFNVVSRIKINIKLYYYWVWIWYSLGFRELKKLNLENSFFINLKKESYLKQKLINMYLINKSKNGIPYCGDLPRLFLKAFTKNIEVFERII